MILIRLLLHAWFRITPMSGLMVVLSLIRLLVFSSSGAGFFAHQSDHNWSARTWGQVDRLHSVDVSLSLSGVFCSVPGPLQSVQKG